MNWLAWQQHRKQFAVLGIALALFAAFTIPTGMHMWDVYQHALATCDKTATCDQLSNELFTSKGYNNAFHFMWLTLLSLPVLLGIFLGVPLVAKEYAEGTNKLVWTQGISRRKWLTIKLLWTLIAAAAFTLAFAALATYWWRAGNALNLNRFQAVSFATQGFVPAAYAVFAVALGTALGAWFKRTLLALGVTMGILIVTFVAVPQLVRPHYQSPAVYKTSIAETINARDDPRSPSIPANAGAGGAWKTNAILAKNNGDVIDWGNPPAKCIRTDADWTKRSSEQVAKVPDQSRQSDALIGVNGSDQVSLQCLGTLGYGWTIQYQPSYRYWNFQRIEVALFLGLSVIPVAATYWLVLKRDA